MVLGRSARSGDLAILAIFWTNFYVGIEQNYGITAKIARTQDLAGMVGYGYLSYLDTDLSAFFSSCGLPRLNGSEQEKREKKSRERRRGFIYYSLPVHSLF